MKLINCPACERECSAQAITCPNCGHPLKSESTFNLSSVVEPKTTNIWRILTVGLAAVVLLAVGIFAVFNYTGIATTLLSPSKSLSDAQRKAVDEAMGELRKLDAATEVGISKIEYHKLLIPAQASTKKASDVLPDGSLKKALNSAMEAYNDADTLWNLKMPKGMMSDEMVDRDFFTACFTQPTPSTNSNALTRSFQDYFNSILCDSVGSGIAKKYDLPMKDLQSGEPSKESGKVEKKVALNIVWLKAKQELDTARGIESAN